MPQPTYKITDMDALEKACPQAVVTIKTIDRAKITRLWNAASALGMSIPGIEAVDTKVIDKVLKVEATETKSFIAEMENKAANEQLRRSAEL